MANGDDVLEAARRQVPRPLGQSYFPAARAIGWSNAQLMRPEGLLPRAKIGDSTYGGIGVPNEVRPPQLFDLSFRPTISQGTMDTPRYYPPLPVQRFLGGGYGFPIDYRNQFDTSLEGGISNRFGYSPASNIPTAPIFGLGMNNPDWHKRYGFGF